MAAPAVIRATYDVKLVCHEFWDWLNVVYECSQSQTGKATIENAQLFQLAMKLARFSNNSEEKQAFQEKAEKLWKFLTNATGILDPASFQVVYSTLRCLTLKLSIFWNPQKKAKNSGSFLWKPRDS